MSMGIENFRDLTTKGDLESRRLRLEGQDQQQEVRAPKSAWGRFVSWVKGENITDDRKTQNNTVRRAFYDALMKAYPDIAKEVIKDTFGNLRNDVHFKTIGSDLRVSDIKKVLDSAETLRLKRLGETTRSVTTFLDGGNLKTAAKLSCEKYGHPRLRSNDPELQRTFLRLVSADPRYGRKGFTHDDLSVLAEQAVKLCCEAKKARFDEQYPKLAQLENGVFHDGETYFGEVDRALKRPPLNPLTLSGNTSTKMWFDKALDNIQESSRLLGETEFDPGKVPLLQGEVRQQISEMKALLSTSPQVLREGLRERERIYASDALSRAMEQAIEGCEHDLKSFEPHREIQGRDDLMVNEPINDQRNDPNDLKGILKKDVGLEDKPKKRVQFTEQSKLESDLVNTREDGGLPAIKKGKTRTETKKIEPGDSIDIHRVFDRHLQEFLSGEQTGDERKYLFDPNQREEFARQMVGKFDAYLEDHGVPENERKDRVKTFEQVLRERLFDPGSEDNPNLERMRIALETVQPLQETLREEMQNQIAKLNSKLQYLDNYAKTDPLSEKAIAYDRLIWAQASKSVIDGLLQELANQNAPDPEQLQRLALAQIEAINRVNDAQQAWEQAGFERGRTELDELRDAQSFKDQKDRDMIEMEQFRYLLDLPPENLTNDQKSLRDSVEWALSGQRQATERLNEAQRAWEEAGRPSRFASTAGEIANQNRKSEIRFLNGLLEHAQVRPPRQPDGSRGTVGGMLDRGRIKTLETLQQWQPIVSDVMVSRDGRDRTYRVELIPGSRIGGAVGRTYTEDDLGGVVPGDRGNVRHAPNLWVTKLSRVEYGNVVIDNDDKEQREVQGLVPMFSSISHGVLDAFDLRNPEVRQQAGRSGAKEVLTTAIEINPDFKRRALEKRDQENQRPSKIVHVNINIPTSEVSRMLRDGREGDFIQHQFDAFAGLPDEQGRVLLSMTNDQDQIINSEFQLDTITFAFAASGDGKRSTQFDEHDRQNMLKLVGDLASGSAPGGYIGGLVDRLRTEARRADPEKKQKIEELLLKIGEEVDIVRTEFSSGRYKTAREGRHALTRHVMGVVDLGGEALRLLGDNDTLLSMSQGCRDNLESGTIVDVEHMMGSVTRDMGGQLKPGEQRTEEDRKIFNSLLTGSGHIQQQQMVTGLGGSGSVREVSDQIGNRDVGEYVRGMEPQDWVTRI